MQSNFDSGSIAYIVPLNFGYEVVGQQLLLYIQGAMAGRKYEMLMKNPCCSFEMDTLLKLDCIVDKKDVTMRYKCVMGKATILGEYNANCHKTCIV